MNLNLINFLFMKKHLLSILFIVTLFGCEKSDTEAINYQEKTVSDNFDYHSNELSR